MSVRLVSTTNPGIMGAGTTCETITADEMIAFTARVSNPDNQMNHASAPALLTYLIKHKHWSPFEMVNMCVEITTSRAIAAQILRHKSFSFQEFSQRYAAVDSSSVEPIRLRAKATVNRQSSSKAMLSDRLDKIAQESVEQSFTAYETLLKEGVATECARMVLPLTTSTTMYMNGTLRSWIHYLEQRCSEHTQEEHRDIALSIRDIIKTVYPTVWEAIWGENNDVT